MTYKAPIDAIRFSLEVHGGLDPQETAGILEEAARFAEEQLAQENRRGDRIGARFHGGEVHLPEGWPALYGQWAGAGWNGVDLPAAWGGMGLPTRLATATMEIWTSACMSFSLGPVLTQGAVDLLALHADEALKALYLPRLVSGAWTATMNLTEPQAGSDLGLVSTRAEPVGDGTFRLFGSKIFITYGEHDLTDNIIHLVLARLPGAPEGTKGISLFLVPKFLVNRDGSLGPRNDVVCTGIEHKLGIHASPTCSMRFGETEGAVGWLVGEPNRGLACMFTMMNKARLFTGLQGVAIAERATQKAVAFAQERKQGRAAGSHGVSPLIAHPDVRRMLARMRALTAAARAIAHCAARAIDQDHGGDRAGLLTPITKAYCSEIGCEVTSLGVQVHGGMGYVEETGAAQLFRDARITPIYEGTNGIQAIDLVLRKVLRPGSSLAETVISEFEASGNAAIAAGLDAVGAPTIAAAEALLKATRWLRGHSNNAEMVLGAASPYLKLFATAAASALLADGAVIAKRRIANGDDSPFFAAAISDATTYAQTEAVFAPANACVVTDNRVAPPELLAS